MTSKTASHAKSLILAPVVNTDSLAWTNPLGGSWGAVANWTDTTTGADAIVTPGAANAIVTPGAANAVSITGAATAFTDVAGSGAAAQLAVAGDVLFLANVAVGGAVSLAGSADLELDGAASITSASFTTAASAFVEVGGGSALTVSGAASLTSSFLGVIGGSTAQLALLVANGENTIAVDDASSLEIGSLGGATVGFITIDKGQATAASGEIYGNLKINGTLAVQAGASLSIDQGNNPVGAAVTIDGAGTLAVGERSYLSLGVADSAAIQFDGPSGSLSLSVLPSGTISGFAAGDTIEMLGLATGLSYKQTSAGIATLTLTKGSHAAGTLTLAGNYTGSLFHLSIDRWGNDNITLQTVGSAATAPSLITGSTGSDTLYAVANNETLTGLGGIDTLEAGAFGALSGIVFKDTSANLNGSTLQGVAGTDIIDLTDMTPGAARISYTPAQPGVLTDDGWEPAIPLTLTVTAGTHSAAMFLTTWNGSALPTGYFTAGSDGGGGTDLRFVTVQTVATANNQTLSGFAPLSGIGGTATLNGQGFTGIDFKATSTIFTGDTLAGFDVSDVIDLTDMKSSAVTLHYTPGQLASWPYIHYNVSATLMVTDGTHSATLSLANATEFSTIGYFTASNDGSGGTDLRFTQVQTVATSNNQTLSGVGGSETLDGKAFTGIDFKATSTIFAGATLAGFDISDVVDLTDMKSSAASISYAPAQPGVWTTNGYKSNPATLTATDGTHSVVVSLIGSTSAFPTGYFTTGSDGAGGIDVTYVIANTDAYAYTSGFGGSYALAGNWSDTTTSAATLAAPSYGNAVTIAGGTIYTDINGVGVAASLTTSGDVLLSGSLSVGSLIAGASGSLTQSGTLALDSHAALTLAGTADIAGELEIGGGGRLTAGGIVFNAAGASLLAVGGSSVQFAKVASAIGQYEQTVFNQGTIGVDGSSSIEFGMAGSVATGALTIDSGVAAQFQGAIFGNVVVNGTLVLAGNLAIGGYGQGAATIGGTGTIEIATGDSLTLATTDSAAILFDAAATSTYGNNSTLVVQGALPTGTITGFAQGDVITVAHPVTRLAYNQASATLGTLTLFNGSVAVGSLSMAGSYAASQFALQLSGSGQTSSVSYLPAPATAPGTQISTNADSFTWTGLTGGVWNNAANWTDGTSGKLAVAAPGSSNAVTFSNVPPEMISGSGYAASASITGGGDVFTGSLTVTGAFTTSSSSYFNSPSPAVAFIGGAALSAKSLNVDGSLQLAGASTATIAGVSQVTGSLTVISASNVKVVGAMTLGSVNEFAAPVPGSVAVDATSSIKIGAAGSAATGALSIDAMQTLTLDGASVSAALIVNGTLVATNSTNNLYVNNYSVETDKIQGFAGAVGSITGSGTLDIQGGANLLLNASDTTTIAFQGPHWYEYGYTPH